MDIIRNILLVLHFVGLASILGGALVQLMAKGTKRVTAAIMHGSWLQLITGLGLVGVIEMGAGHVDNSKIAVKLVVLIVITVIAFINRKRDHVASWIIPSITTLTLANIVVAVFWK